MKLIYMILILCIFLSCKEQNNKDKSIDKFKELKKDVGLPQTYTDTLTLISLVSSDRINYDKKFLKIDYKKKLDSLYQVIEEELNIIGFENHFTEDAKKAFNELKASYVIDEKASLDMWNASYGTNYKYVDFDENSFKKIKQMIYKRRYEELLIYNFHLRINLTRSWEEPHTFLYRKRLKELMAKKFLDSMYPKKKNQ